MEEYYIRIRRKNGLFLFGMIIVVLYISMIIVNFFLKLGDSGS